MLRMYRHLQSLVLVIMGLALMATSAQAQGDEAFLKHRQKVMQAVGGHMGAIGAIMKNKLPYQATIAAHAQALQMTSTVIEDAFKKEITEGKTDSKPDIWQDWKKFVAAANKMGDESGKLAKIAASGNMAAIGAQVKALGKSCGGCHKPFRKPKKERFKR